MVEIDALYAWLVPAGVLAGLVLFATLLSRLLKRHYRGVSGGQQRRQVTMLAVAFGGLLLVVVSLPISDTLRGQVLSLIGILLSAAIALSSTTFVGNIMAGMMLNSLGGFRIGDFIRVGEHFGRVSERGLLHVEIQTEDRDLTTLPNLFLVTQPVKVVHAEGTIIAATVSLGYDVSRHEIERCLLAAAEEAGLEDAFVGITALGDFSVSYRVAGRLNDVKKLISTRSRLMALALDQLHAADIEIVSPDFVALRRLDSRQRVVPADHRPSEQQPATDAGPEKMLFDKADQAESTERLREKLAETVEQLEAAEAAHKAAGEAVAGPTAARVEALRRRQQRYEDLLARRDAE